MKRFVSKATALLLVAIFAFSNVSIANAAASDISGHWSESFMSKLISWGFMRGYGDGTYKPDNTMTRAEAATLINQIFNFTEKSPKNYPDVAQDKWYADQLSIAKQAEFFVEMANGNAVPDFQVSKQQVATMINNIYGFSGFLPKSDNLAKVNDSKIISPYAQEAVNAMIAEGIIVGDENANFQPHKALTRAEASTVLAKTVGDVITDSNASDKVFDGNALVRTAVASLKNVVIKGHLFISKAVTGKVALNNVTIDRALIVSGNMEIAADNKTNIGMLISKGGLTINGTKVDAGKWVKITNGSVAGSGTVSASTTTSESGSSSSSDSGGGGGGYIPPAGVTVTGVSVKTSPAKTTYNAGESLDLSGLEVTLTYSNNTNYNVSFASFASMNLTTSPSNGAQLSTADNKVVITHTPTQKTAEFGITVNSQPGGEIVVNYPAGITNVVFQSHNLTGYDDIATIMIYLENSYIPEFEYLDISWLEEAGWDSAKLTNLITGSRGTYLRAALLTDKYTSQALIDAAINAQTIKFDIKRLFTEGDFDAIASDPEFSSAVPGVMAASVYVDVAYISIVKSVEAVIDGKTYPLSFVVGQPANYRDTRNIPANDIVERTGKIRITTNSGVVMESEQIPLV